MSQNKITQYKTELKILKPKKKFLKKMIMSFVIGGGICVLAEALYTLYTSVCKMNQEESISYMLMSLIFISSLLTSFGVYDTFGGIAYAGSIIPITGFANSLTSSALDYKSEGIIHGIFSNVLRLAGAVIVSGIIISTLMGFIYYFIEVAL